MSYDVMYQDWLQAKRNKDYSKADEIRSVFEKEHGLTIFAEGQMPVEGVTVKRMTAADWEKKYGDSEVSEILYSQGNTAMKYL